MLRLSQLNWPRILYSRSTAVLLGIAAALTIPALVLIHSDLAFGSFSSGVKNGLSILGAAGAFGLVALLICMGFFWLRCDPSTKGWRTIWFVVLLLGFAYGSQVAYYVFVYLPAVRKKLRGPSLDDAAVGTAEEKPDRRRIGAFSKVLLSVWCFLSLPMIAELVAPKLFPSAFGAVASLVFALCSFVVAIECVVRALCSVFRSGVGRPDNHE